MVVGCPSLRVGVKLGGKGGHGRGGGCQFLSLREAYILKLSLLRSLEPLEKFVVVVVVGGWCLNVNLVIGFGPSPGLGL